MKMKIKIFGTGCSKCKRLYDNAASAIKESGISCELEKIEDIKKITEIGIMMTPALAIDDEVKSIGRIVDVAEIKKYLLKK